MEFSLIKQPSESLFNYVIELAAEFSNILLYSNSFHYHVIPNKQNFFLTKLYWFVHIKGNLLLLLIDDNYYSNLFHFKRSAFRLFPASYVHMRFNSSSTFWNGGSCIKTNLRTVCVFYFHFTVVSRWWPFI